MDVDALNKLKRKVSEEFNTLLCRVKKGYRPDYEFILEEISFIDLIQNNEKVIFNVFSDKDEEVYKSTINELDSELLLTALQYYLNNKWQIIQS